jgi:hypothetical protein
MNTAHFVDSRIEIDTYQAVKDIMDGLAVIQSCPDDDGAPDDGVEITLKDLNLSEGFTSTDVYHQLRGYYYFKAHT